MTVYVIMDYGAACTKIVWSSFGGGVFFAVNTQETHIVGIRL